MKRILLIVLSVVLVACVFAGCQQTQTADDAQEETSAGIANPVVDVSGLDELNNPVTLPSGTEGTSYAIIDDTVDEVNFVDADGNAYMVRATQDQDLAENLEAFTGYNGEWKTQEGMGDIKYAHVKVDSTEYYVAHWQSSDGVFYCLVGPSECEDQVVKYAEEMSGY